MKIYVASSWRCERQPLVVAALRDDGHEVYDFRNPREGDRGFHWTDVGLRRDDEGKCTVGALIEAHKHPIAERGFAYDFDAMKWADAFVLVLPCGRSAHLEAGWALGQSKLTYILMDASEKHEPELMYKLANLSGGSICTSVQRLCDTVGQGKRPARGGC